MHPGAYANTMIGIQYVADVAGRHALYYNRQGGYPGLIIARAVNNHVINFFKGFDKLACVFCFHRMNMMQSGPTQVIVRSIGRRLFAQLLATKPSKPYLRGVQSGNTRQ